MRRAQRPRARGRPGGASKPSSSIESDLVTKEGETADNTEATVALTQPEADRHELAASRFKSVKTDRETRAARAPRGYFHDGVGEIQTDRATHGHGESVDISFVDILFLAIFNTHYTTPRTD